MNPHAPTTPYEHLQVMNTWLASSTGVASPWNSKALDAWQRWERAGGTGVMLAAVVKRRLRLGASLDVGCVLAECGLEAAKG